MTYSRPIPRCSRCGSKEHNRRRCTKTWPLAGPRWEYLVRNHDHGAYDGLLTAYGAGGWELVTVIQLERSCVFYFKRPATPAPREASEKKT